MPLSVAEGSAESWILRRAKEKTLQHDLTFKVYSHRRDAMIRSFNNRIKSQHRGNYHCTSGHEYLTPVKCLMLKHKCL